MTPAFRDRGSFGTWRIVLWSGAALLLSLPLVAMQFTPEVAWDGADFLVFGALLAVACGTIELGAQLSRDRSYRAGIAIAAATGFLLVWANLAVGVIGDEGNPANLLFAGVLAVGVIGALLARLRAGGMARTLFAMASAQALVGIYALVVGSFDAAVATLVFVVLWIASALLFRHAARDPAREAKAS